MQVKVNSAKKWFMQLSFKKKLLILFSLSTFLILAITDIIMNILLTSRRQENFAIISQQRNQYNVISTGQIVQSLAKVGHTALDRFTQLLVELTQAYAFFKANPTIYTSLQTLDPHNPPLTDQFANASYTSSGIYFKTPNSTFYNDSFIDVILSNMAYYRYPGVKRVNVIYYKTSNPLDMMARTLPGWKDFTIPDPQIIVNRTANLVPGYAYLSSNYTDQFSKSSNNTLLISIRTVIIPQDDPGVRILFEVQVYQDAISIILGNVYYYSSTNAFFVQITKNGYVVLSSLKPIQLDLTPFLDVGVRQLTLVNGTTIVGGSVGVHQSHKLTQFSIIENDNNSKFRFIVVTDKQQTDKPYNIMSAFLNQQISSILTILYTWSVFVLLLCTGLAIVVGNHVFHHLHFLASRTQQYIRDPKTVEGVISQLNSLQVQGKIKDLIQSLIKIIQKIESRKKDIVQQKQGKYKFPLNICNRQFQKKVGLEDYKIMDQIYEDLCKKFPPKNPQPKPDQSAQEQKKQKLQQSPRKSPNKKNSESLKKQEKKQKQPNSPIKSGSGSMNAESSSKKSSSSYSDVSEQYKSSIKVEQSNQNEASRKKLRTMMQVQQQEFAQPRKKRSGTKL